MSAHPPVVPSVLHPLDDFYRRRHQTLPPFRILAGDAMPEPYRQLLVHDRDMTSTLETFHGKPIHLEVLERQISGDTLQRQVVLRLDESDLAVEFGAIRVHLARFTEPWRSQVVESYRPLGGILNRSGINYTSKPSGFFAIQGDPFLASALDMPVGSELFGRQNTLRTTSGEVIAEIIEILPRITDPT